MYSTGLCENGGVRVTFSVYIKGHGEHNYRALMPTNLSLLLGHNPVNIFHLEFIDRVTMHHNFCNRISDVPNLDKSNLHDVKL